MLAILMQPFSYPLLRASVLKHLKLDVYIDDRWENCVDVARHH